VKLARIRKSKAECFLPYVRIDPVQTQAILHMHKNMYRTCIQKSETGRGDQGRRKKRKEDCEY
jgi:hypothetical protein